jgi:hypothetical protein
MLQTAAPPQPSDVAGLPPVANPVAHRIFTEGGIGMAQAARFYPIVRLGRPANASTVYRHCTDGIKLADGSTLKLESCRWCGRLLTSEAAVARFLSAQNAEPVDAADRTRPAPRTPNQRRRAAERAARELAAPL